jgi:hypothetical protein
LFFMKSRFLALFDIDRPRTVYRASNPGRMSMIEAFPLCWPDRRPRTESAKRQRSRFKTGFTAAVRNILAELRRLGASNVVVSSNIPTGRGGLPLASAKRVDDIGVAVYFTLKGKERCFVCDRWDEVGDNILAIAKTIGAIRGTERWGTGDMVEAAFAGFDLLPSPDDWRSELGHPTTWEEAEATYRQRSRTAHPDVPGGSHETMTRLNRAREAARAALS